MDFDKVVERLNNMLFGICGCNCIESEIALKECLSRIKNNPRYNQDLVIYAKHIEILKKGIKDNCEDYITRLKPLIDSQILKSDEFFKELSKTEEGRKKLLEIKSFQMERE